MTRIAIIIGSTRPGRNGESVARWVLEHAEKREGVEYELVDLAEWNLPHLDEPMPAAMGQYANDHTKAWAAKIAEFDGYLFVTPEYNHSTSGALKNAIDFVGSEWYNKAAGFVSYGVFGGARAVEHLRNIMTELQAVSVRHAVHIGGSEFASVFMGQKTWDEVLPTFAPFTKELFDNLLWWTNATKAARATDAAAAKAA